MAGWAALPDEARGPLAAAVRAAWAGLSPEVRARALAAIDGGGSPLGG